MSGHTSSLAPLLNWSLRIKDLKRVVPLPLPCMRFLPPFKLSFSTGCFLLWRRCLLWCRMPPRW
eukprot:6516161-Prorocentrum_lima.AAC.1